ncbi:MAG: class I SAM-dependent methyltransferase [Candidatus Humimicrobiaceae bacterium]
MARISPFEKHSQLYEEWFEENEYVYQSEIKAIKSLMPDFKSGVEIGVGSGQFAVPLGVKLGIEPSRVMSKIARSKGIEVIEGVGENIPLENSCSDMVLMVTTLCFLDDAKKTFFEVFRILKDGGSFITGFVDKDSSLGKIYQKNKDKSLFYGLATFFSVKEVIEILEDTGFKNYQFKQTIFKPLNEIDSIEEIKDGYGEGSFVVIRAIR